MKWGRLGLGLLLSLQMQTVSAAQSRTKNPPSGKIDSALFPIDISPVADGSKDGLYPSQPGIQPPKTGTTPTKPSTGAKEGTMTTSKDVPEKFQCNLFSSSDYSEIFTAAKALSDVIKSPACSSSGISAQQVMENTKLITDMIKKLDPYIQDPSKLEDLKNKAARSNQGAEQGSGQADSPMSPVDRLDQEAAKANEEIKNISVEVGQAINAASALVNTFSNSSLINAECRQQLNGGQMALEAINLLNGLTPYALMGASVAAPAAAPFLAGGAVITSAISSIGNLLNDSRTKIEDATTRRAVVENTCQFIVVEQRYRYLMLSREQQTQRIKAEMDQARGLMSVKISNENSAVNALLNRKTALSKAALDLETSLSTNSASFEAVRQFAGNTTNDVMMCALGIQLVQLTEDNTSYISEMLNSVNQAMTAYGSSNFPQAQALQISSMIAINELKSVSASQLSYNSSATQCAQTTKAFMDLITQSASLSRQIMGLAQVNLSKELERSPEYQQLQEKLHAFDKKQQQAKLVTNSLSNLSKWANNFNQSEIDAEMDRLRSGLFKSKYSGIQSPVMAWFGYVTGLHKGSVEKFKNGYLSLKKRAYLFTKSGQNSNLSNSLLLANTPAGRQQLIDDDKLATNLETLNLKNLPRGSQAYKDACREMTDVWNRWVSASDHFIAVESFCQMINDYIYDNRSEDAALVQICRGRSPSQGVGSPNSSIGKIQSSLKKDGTMARAALLKKKLDSLSCPMPEQLKPE